MCSKPNETEKKYMNMMEKIENEIPYIDIKPFSHNIINLELRLMEELVGEERVVEFIRDNEDLMEKGWGWIVENWDEEHKKDGLVGWIDKRIEKSKVLKCDKCNKIVGERKEEPAIAIGNDIKNGIYCLPCRGGLIIYK